MADEVTKEDLLAIEEEKNVAIWRLKKLVDRLNNTRGNGTSMISLVCPGTEQIPSMTRMLTEEYSTASNIKSRVNRLSVLTAITQTQTRLKLYNRVPKNGLCVYSGTVMTEEGKEKKMSMSFEPFRPINTFLYLCDNKFHTEALEELLNSDEKFGFIIMDGSGTLFAEICGNNRQILQKITVQLPKKHNKGGQSSARFGRI
ncbi:peptide chain release factor eRF1/aRF1, partial [Kipferlia bialata]|eukprot:g7528.t1